MSLDVTGDCGPMLLAAAKRGNVELMNRIFDENKGGLDLNPQDGLGNTPLHYSAQANHTATLSLLLDRGANPNVQNFAGDTALHVAVGKNHKEAIRTLLEGGADANLKNKKGVSAQTIAKSQDIRTLIRSVARVQKEVDEFDDDDMIAELDSDDD